MRSTKTDDDFLAFSPSLSYRVIVRCVPYRQFKATCGFFCHNVDFSSSITLPTTFYLLGLLYQYMAWLATLLLSFLFVRARRESRPGWESLLQSHFYSRTVRKIDDGLGHAAQPIVLHAVRPSAEALSDQSLNNNNPSLIAVPRSLSVMAKTHSRSPSPEPKTAGLKRPKIGHHPSSSTTTSPVVVTPLTPTGDGASGPGSGPAAITTDEDVITCFAPDLLEKDNVDRLATSYASNEPFKHALVDKLFRDDFLQKVKDECLSELHFTEKETDIYKVRFIHIEHSCLPPALLRGVLFFKKFFPFFFYRSIRQAI